MASEQIQQEEVESSDDDSNTDTESSNGSESDKSEQVLADDPKVKKVVKDMEELEEEDDEEEDDLLVQPENRCGKVGSLMREYAVLASTHGVPHMGEAHTIRVVMFWCLVLVCSLGAFCYLFFNTMVDYLSFPVNVVLQLDTGERHFPAITICNLNPYKKSELLNVDATSALVQAYEGAIET